MWQVRARSDDLGYLPIIREIAVLGQGFTKSISSSRSSDIFISSSARHSSLWRRRLAAQLRASFGLLVVLVVNTFPQK